MKIVDKVVIIGGKSSATLIADNLYDAQTKHNVATKFLEFANGFPNCDLLKMF